MHNTFTRDELTRYQRQFVLKEIGHIGQKKLKNARALCIGAGGLGAATLFYLAAAGIGTIGIVDGDSVDLSNLQRQILYTTEDVGKNKAVVAAQRLQSLNANVNVNTHPSKLTNKNALEIIEPYDLVIDGTDNFAAKYLINDVCCTLKKPSIFASIYQFEGQCSVFLPGAPCYRCLYPNPPHTTVQNCAQAGVLGSLTGIVGSVQATEAIKFILDIGNQLVGRILIVDALSMEFHTYQLKKNKECKTCASKVDDLWLQKKNDYDDIPVDSLASISVHELRILTQKNKSIQLLDVREPYEHEAYNIGGKLISLHHLMDQYEELDKSQPVIIYCETGKRSRDAAIFLTNCGFESVVYLDGGASAWRSLSV